jgi:hypothetical protein
MAGDWIKLETVTPDKPEIRRISEILNISKGDAFLGCFRVWSWFDQHSLNGDVPGVTQALADDESRVTGFGAAMATVGWLDENNGSLAMPHFDYHTSQSAKRRALTAKRSENYRRRQRDALSVTKTSPEKRREENKDNTLDLPMQGGPTEPTLRPAPKGRSGGAEEVHISETIKKLKYEFGGEGNSK